MRNKITKRTVEAIGPSLRDTVLWDTEIPGFGCKVTPKGARIYVLQYSQRDRDHRVTIGRHGVEFTAEQARNEARRLRGAIASGENPALLRSRERSIPTVAELGARYLEECARPHKNPSALAQDLRNLQNHIIPLIGTLQVCEIERSDIARLMRDIAAGKTAKDEKTKLQGTAHLSRWRDRRQSRACVAIQEELTRELSQFLDPPLKTANDNDLVCSPPISA